MPLMKIWNILSWIALITALSFLLVRSSYVVLEKHPYPYTTPKITTTPIPTSNQSGALANNNPTQCPNPCDGGFLP